MNLSLSDAYVQRIIKYLPSGSQHFKAEQFTYYDEHIAPQIIQLGSFIFDANKNIIMKEGVLANTATMETKLIFQGNNLHNKIEEKKEPGKEAMVISYSDGLHQRANQGGG